MSTLLVTLAFCFPPDLGKFAEGLKDQYVKSTEGNVAVIPCRPPTGNPPTVTEFEVNGSRLQLKSGEVFHDYQITTPFVTRYLCPLPSVL